MAKKNKAGLIEKAPRAPEYFGEYAKNEWSRILKIMVEEKLATTLDLCILEGACVQYGIYREMWDAVTVFGTRSIGDYIEERGGNSQKQGELTTMNKAFEQYTKVMRMFGATPAARRTMKITEKEKKEGDSSERDPLEDDLDL